MQNIEPTSSGQPKQTAQANKKIVWLVIIFLVLILSGLVFYYRQSIVQLLKIQKEQVNPSIEETVVIKESQVSKPNPTKKPLPPIDKQEGSQVSAQLLAVNQKSSYLVGEPVVVSFEADLPAQVDAVEFVTQFDPEYFANMQFVPGTSFDNYLAKKVFPDRGLIKVMAVRNPGQSISAGRVKLGEFRAEAVKSGQVNFIFDQEKSNIAASGGVDILDTTTPLQINITNQQN